MPDDEQQDQADIPGTSNDYNGQQKSRETLSAFVEREFFTRRSKYPKNPPQILQVVPEIEDLYYEEYKRRQTMKRTLMKSRGLETPVSAADTESQDGRILNDPVGLLPLPEGSDEK